MYGLANSLKHQGKYPEARELYEKVLKVRQRVLDPDHRSTIGSMNSLVLLLQREGKLEEAQRLLEETLKVMRRALSPNDPYTLGVEINMAVVLVDQGKYEEARLANEKNLKRMLDALGPIHPGTIMSMSNLAWILATHLDGKFHDQKKAMEYAKKAVEVMPEEADYWNTLGIVHYKSGDMQSAIETLEKSMKLRSGGDPNEWLFLAMAEWRLNHKDKARKWYDKSLIWMKSRKPNNPNLIRFRDEAAELLGTLVRFPRLKS